VPVDVIVTDMVMPRMDGAQLLTEVVKLHPTTVRLVLSGHAEHEAMFRLVGPAHQCLSKPCDAEELRAAIARALALRELLSDGQLKKLASRIPCLPSLPALHLRLTDELQKEEASIERVAEIISRDIGMTAKILQLVNSAFFGLAQPALNVTQAVTYLGLATIRALVLSLKVFSQFDQRTMQEFSIHGLEQHSWMTGVLARRIAEMEQGERKLDDQCFLAGLLHDVGFLILAAGLPENYAGILRAARQGGKPVWEIEQVQLGATHAEVGAYLLGLWGLPDLVVEAVAFHHRPADCPSRGFSPVIAVHVADSFTRNLTPNHAEHPGNPIDLACLAAAGLGGRVDEWRQRCAEDHLASR
jgi:HD-like signal output (HDOD) protein